jgi:uncharacterized BrkB/YihY/UPF0761 family membrane protein
MKPSDTTAADDDHSPGRTKRMVVRGRLLALELGRRADETRQRSSTVDGGFEVFERDSEVGGGILAGALAYRLFIWLLPAALVAVGGLGLWSSATNKSPTAATHEIGLTGIVANSISQASKGDAHWYALLVGIPLLLYATRSLLRALRATHYLIWSSRIPRGAVTPRATLEFLLALIGYFFATVLAAFVRERSGLGGISASILIAVVYGLLWLVVSSRLPHADATLRDLVPGAAVYGVGAVILQLVAVYFVVPQAAHRQQTYGTIGAAAALLLGLYFLGRLMVFSAVVNSTLWLRRVSHASQSEREHDLHDPAQQGRRADPDHEQDLPVSEVTRRPEAEDQLDDAGDEEEPPPSLVA